MKIYNRYTRELIIEVQEVKADLQGADLRGANLRGANLRGADLQGADLQGADLQGADLCDCNFHEAKISYRGKIIKITFSEVK